MCVCVSEKTNIPMHDPMGHELTDMLCNHDGFVCVCVCVCVCVIVWYVGPWFEKWLCDAYDAYDATNACIHVCICIYMQI